MSAHRDGPAKEAASSGEEMTYLEAISSGLRDEMRADESVICLGEDIAAFGGAFKVTDGFLDEFGPERVIDTPLAENVILGAATGAAIEGMKVVCEMQFADFIACGFDQLVNVAAKLHYRQGIAVPIVVRLPSGGGFSGGPFHSQNPEAWFLQSPGLKVVAPATAADAKGLLVSAIRDPNPVCFLEHKGLYRHVRDEVPAGEYAVPIGEARVAREGGEMTVIAYGSSVHLAMRGRRRARGGDRGARPALARSARRGRDPRERGANRQGPDRPRGDAILRSRRRGRGADRRARLRAARRSREAIDRARRRRSRSARRSSRRRCRSSSR